MALDWSWQNFAACRGEDLVLFFGREGERPPERDLREQKAKAVCSYCPVRNACLDFALSADQKHGMWGGLSEDERASERRRRMRRAAREQAPAIPPGTPDDKRCRDCKQVKPVTAFHRDRQTSDGLNIYCKPCVNAQKRLFRDRKRRDRKKVA